MAHSYVNKVIIAIVIIAILLLIIGIVVLVKSYNKKAGFWVTGLGVVLTGYCIWLYKYLNEKK